MHSFRNARNVIDHKVKSKRENAARERQFAERMIQGSRLAAELITIKRKINDDACRCVRYGQLPFGLNEWNQGRFLQATTCRFALAFLLLSSIVLPKCFPDSCGLIWPP
jgi:hypothetical protein